MTNETLTKQILDWVKKHGKAKMPKESIELMFQAFNATTNTTVKKNLLEAIAISISEAPRPGPGTDKIIEILGNIQC